MSDAQPLQMNSSSPQMASFARDVFSDQHKQAIHKLTAKLDRIMNASPIDFNDGVPVSSHALAPKGAHPRNSDLEGNGRQSVRVFYDPDPDFEGILKSDSNEYNHHPRDSITHVQQNSSFQDSGLSDGDLKLRPPARLLEFERPLENQLVYLNPNGGNEAQCLSLVCALTQLETRRLQVRWLFNEQSRLPLAQFNTAFDGKTARLLAKHLRPEHSGSYACEIQLPCGSSMAYTQCQVTIRTQLHPEQQTFVTFEEPKYAAPRYTSLTSSSSYHHTLSESHLKPEQTQRTVSSHCEFVPKVVIPTRYDARDNQGCHDGRWRSVERTSRETNSQSASDSYSGRRPTTPRKPRRRQSISRDFISMPSDSPEDATKTLSDVSDNHLLDHYSDRLSTSGRVKSLGQIDPCTQCQQGPPHHLSLGSLTTDPRVILINTHPYCYCHQPTHQRCHHDEHVHCCTRRLKHNRHISFNPDPECYCGSDQFNYDNGYGAWIEEEEEEMRQPLFVKIPEGQQRPEIKVQPKNKVVSSRKIDAKWNRGPVNRLPTTIELQTPEAAAAAKEAVKKILEARYGDPPAQAPPKLARKINSKLNPQDIEYANHSKPLTVKISKIPKLSETVEESQYKLNSKIDQPFMENVTSDEKHKIYSFRVNHNSDHPTTLFNPLTAMQNVKTVCEAHKTVNLHQSTKETFKLSSSRDKLFEYNSKNSCNPLTKQVISEVSEKLGSCSSKGARIDDYSKSLYNPLTAINNKKNTRESSPNKNELYSDVFRKHDVNKKNNDTTMTSIQPRKSIMRRNFDLSKEAQQEMSMNEGGSKTVNMQLADEQIKPSGRGEVNDLLCYHNDSDLKIQTISDSSKNVLDYSLSQPNQNIASVEEPFSAYTDSFNSEREDQPQEDIQNEAKARFANALAHFKANAEETDNHQISDGQMCSHQSNKCLREQSESSFGSAEFQNKEVRPKQIWRSKSISRQSNCSSITPNLNFDTSLSDLTTPRSEIGDEVISSPNLVTRATTRGFSEEQSQSQPQNATDWNRAPVRGKVFRTFSQTRTTNAARRLAACRSQSNNGLDYKTSNEAFSFPNEVVEGSSLSQSMGDSCTRNREAVNKASDPLTYLNEYFCNNKYIQEPLSLLEMKNVVLTFVQRNTREYSKYGISVNNFSTSWSDGVALAALIHHFFPTSFDFPGMVLSKNRNPRDNFRLAQSTAWNLTNVPQMIDVETEIPPDWRKVFLYISHLLVALDGNPYNQANLSLFIRTSRRDEKLM